MRKQSMQQNASARSKLYQSQKYKKNLQQTAQQTKRQRDRDEHDFNPYLSSNFEN